MESINKEYLILFNAITEMEHELEHLRKKLICVQQQAEEAFIVGGEDDPEGEPRPHAD